MPTIHVSVWEHPYTPCALLEISSSPSLEIQNAPVITVPPTSGPFNPKGNCKVELDDKETHSNWDNVACGARPQEDAESRALYDKLYLQSKTKDELEAKVNETEMNLGDMWLGVVAAEGDNEKCQIYTGLTWDMFLVIFHSLSKFVRFNSWVA